jgi:hypothetical protein
MEPSVTAYGHMSRHGFEPGLLIALADHLHHTFRSQHSLTLSQSKFYYLSKKAESICFGFQTFQPLTSRPGRSTFHGFSIIGHTASNQTAEDNRRTSGRAWGIEKLGGM